MTDAAKPHGLAGVTLPISAELAGLADEVLRARLNDLNALPAEQITASHIDGLYKLLVMVEKISQDTRLLEKAVLVMDSYVDYLKRTLPPDDIEGEFQRINGFLLSLEEQEG